MAARPLPAGVLFPDPPGGWTYRYDGNQLLVGEPNTGFTSLDGTWSHDNGSDQWDGSVIGGTLATGAFGVGNAPGGLATNLEASVSYLRIQDCGDPRDYGYADPGNRKLYLTHSMTADGATDSQMQDGVTLSFRARIPTAGKSAAPLDGWYRDGQQAGGVLPYPAAGDGYVTYNGGKGNIVIREVAGGTYGGSIAFSLTQTNDTTGGGLTPTAGFAGLTMNEFNGNTVSDNVNFGQGSATNVIAFDPTDWHSFWIVLKKDPANVGTFRVPRTGTLNTFEYAVLSDLDGKPITLTLSGKETLRLTAIGASENLVWNYLAIVPNAAGATGPVVSAIPGPGATGVLPDVTVDIAVHDGQQPVAQNSVTLRIDGTEVAAVVTKQGTITSVKYTPPAFWVAGSAHAVNLTCNDGTARSFDWGFTMANYPVLTAAMKVADAHTAGFVWRMFQNEASQDTTIQHIEDALAGRLKGADNQPLPNLADPNATGPASGTGEPNEPGSGTMTFKIPTVINVSQVVDTMFGTFTPDEQMPGVPGLNASTDGISAEIRTFVQLPRGWVTMGVNSDDGFQTSAGFLNDYPLVLAEVNGGRSAGDTIFQFAVEEAGVYAFRTLWMEGNGDASIEWFSVQADGSRLLLNDTAGGGFAAFQLGTVPARPPLNVTVTIKTAANGTVVIEWPAGTLQAADQINGPFQTVDGASSPYPTTPTGAQKFYRIKVQ